LDAEKKKINSERGVDGELDLRRHSDVVLHGKALLVIDTEELVNKLILARIKFLELSLVAIGMVNLHLLLGDVVAAMSSKVQGIGWVHDVDVAVLYGCSIPVCLCQLIIVGCVLSGAFRCGYLVILYDGGYGLDNIRFCCSRAFC